MSDATPRPAAASRVVSIEVMKPRHANPSGGVFGGELMCLADRVASLAAVRHAGCRALTVRVDEMRFLAPCRVGHILTAVAQVAATGRTSMEVAAWIDAETMEDPTPVRIFDAHFLMVSVDDDGQPVPCPPVVAEDEHDRVLAAAAERYRARRRALDAS